jgi:hypothetical protein
MASIRLRAVEWASIIVACKWRVAFGDESASVSIIAIARLPSHAFRPTR